MGSLLPRQPLQSHSGAQLPLLLIRAALEDWGTVVMPRGGATSITKPPGCILIFITPSFSFFPHFFIRALEGIGTHYLIS